VAPYPLTAAGLLVQLDAEAADLPTYVAELRSIGTRLSPATTITRQSAHDPRRGRRRSPVTGVGRHHPAAELLGDLMSVAIGLPVVREGLRGASRPPRATTSPLYIPPGIDREVLVDAGTGEPAPTDRGVPWWPSLSTAAIEAGATQVEDVPAAAVELLGCWLDPYVFAPAPGMSYRNPVMAHIGANSPIADLIGWAAAFSQVRARDVGYHQAVMQLRGGSGEAGAQRRRMRAIANRYRALTDWLAPFGDALTARLGAYVELLTSALADLLTPEGITMPTLTSAPAVVTSLATRIRDAITAGHGGRLIVNESEVAFSWAPGVPTSLLTYLAPEWVEGRRTTVVTARDSATPVPPGGVAEGGAKPDVVEFDSAEVNLVKYPGQATITVESAMFVRGIEPAIANISGSQIVRAIEADAVTAMQAGAGVEVTDAKDITSGVLAAIALLRAGGAQPNAVALSVNDWVAVMEATGGAGYLNFSSAEAGPAGTWLGLAPCIVSSLPDGSAVVVDGRSAPIGEPKGQPLCVVDPFTQAKNNKIVITVESWALPMVTSPGGVATVNVAVTP